jgi:hypothetical protein
MISRRSFLKISGGVGLGALAAGGYALGTVTTSALKLQRVDVTIPTLPTVFDGYTIGFVSDMHLGYYVPTDIIAASADLLRPHRCDLVALGGDYIWHPDEDKIWERRNTDFRGVSHAEVPKKVFARIADIYAALNPRDGVIAVRGNHDMWIAPRLCLEAFSARGITVLDNGVREIVRGDARIYFVGVADLWTGSPHFTLLPERGQGVTTILLAHNPDYVAESLGRDDRRFELALCGHTHGGQVRLPFGGVVFDNVADKRFVSGLVQVGPQQVFTSTGIGVVEIPVRINCPPEAVVVTLRANGSPPDAA